MKLKKTNITPLILAVNLLFLSCIISCRTIKTPESISVVEPFDVKKYSGTWYEIARYDFKHEKDLNSVTANYTLNDNGSIKVVNRGFNYVTNKWQESTGKAKFLDDTNKGALKVSFFGPFYAGYNVVALTPDYGNALIYGETKDYIWILSRTKKISNKVKEDFLKKAEQDGYDLSRLVWTQQE